MTHEVVLDLKDEVTEVRRDNARLEELLANKARSGRREDFDKEVQQDSRGQPPIEAPTPSRSRMQGKQADRARNQSDGLCRLDPIGAQAEGLHNPDL
ncbi:hypothetical protein PanWU01x14_269110 [Parasponia andersonii]|uniref:Uncharacterized protein n=1 Tax=Parasponia andersonii TaxID=3476 RepID=A0A2P5B5Q7_PARAD|nr:hypothetical protein PanWU01x14_269110 [Parasponia andersonii]